jgi:hypothetical protein
MTKSLGEIACTAYFRAAGDKEPIQWDQWDDMWPDLRDAWQAAAEAVLKHVLGFIPGEDWRKRIPEWEREQAVIEAAREWARCDSGKGAARAEQFLLLALEALGKAEET